MRGVGRGTAGKERAHAAGYPRVYRAIGVALINCRVYLIAFIIIHKVEERARFPLFDDRRRRDRFLGARIKRAIHFGNEIAATRGDARRGIMHLTACEHEYLISDIATRRSPLYLLSSGVLGRIPGRRRILIIENRRTRYRCAPLQSRNIIHCIRGTRARYNIYRLTTR